MTTVTMPKPEYDELIANKYAAEKFLVEAKENGCAAIKINTNYPYYNSKLVIINPNEAMKTIYYLLETAEKEVRRLNNENQELKMGLLSTYNKKKWYQFWK